MTWGRRKPNAKLAENQPSLLNFPVTSPFSFFSLRRGLQPPPPSSPVATKPSHVVVASLLSLLCKTLLLCHRDPKSSSNNNHLAQKLFLVPKTAKTTSLSSAAPTVPTVSFPSPLQASTSFSSSCNHSQPPASPPPVAPWGHQSGRQLSQCQVSFPPLFFFFLPSLL